MICASPHGSEPPPRRKATRDGVAVRGPARQREEWLPQVVFIAKGEELSSARW